jgi:hypothetical protein
LIAAVAVHLAATGLLDRELDAMPESLEDLHDSLPCLREQRVVEAGDEERDLHSPVAQHTALRRSA